MIKMADPRDGIYKKIKAGRWKTHRIGSYLRITWGEFGYSWQNLSQGGNGNGALWDDSDDAEWKRVKIPAKYNDEQDLEPLTNTLSDVLKKLNNTYKNAFVAKACPHCGALSLVKKGELSKL